MFLIRRYIPVDLRNQNVQLHDFYLDLGRFLEISADEPWLELNNAGTMRVCDQGPDPLGKAETSPCAVLMFVAIVPFTNTLFRT